MRASSQTDVMETRDGYISEALFDDGPLQTSCSPESSDSEPESITAKREKHLKLIQSAFRGKRGEQPLKSKTPLKVSAISCNFLPTACFKLKVASKSCTYCN